VDPDVVVVRVEASVVGGRIPGEGAHDLEGDEGGGRAVVVLEGVAGDLHAVGRQEEDARPGGGDADADTGDGDTGGGDAADDKTPATIAGKYRVADSYEAELPGRLRLAFVLSDPQGFGEAAARDLEDFRPAVAIRFGEGDDAVSLR